MNTQITDKDLLCPECKGEKELPCDCGCPNCEATVLCEECNGTGYDPDKVDLARWQEALEKSRTYLGYEPRVLEENGIMIGVRSFSGKHILRAAKFLLPEAETRYIPQC